MLRWLVFTDLDGTLLDRNTYEWSPASEALEALKQNRIPIVFCSSKTRAEQEHYQREMAIDGPFIVENGSAIILPENEFAPASIPKQHRRLNGKIAVELGWDSARVRSRLENIRSRNGFAFRGFSEMSDGELAELTHLSGELLQRARQRDYSETISIQFEEAELPRFRQALADEGLATVSGGKLHTVTAASAGKAKALRRLLEMYRRRDGARIAVGLGDSPNDRSMLKQVDIAFQIQRPDGTWFDLQLPDVHRVDGAGPTGWNQAILAELAAAQTECAK